MIVRSEVMRAPHAPEPLASPDDSLDPHPAFHEWLYLALVCFLPVEFPFNFELSNLTIQISDLIFVGAAAAWLVALLRRQVKLRPSIFYLPLALYALAMIASTVASVDPRRSLFKLASEFYLLGLAVMTFNFVTSEAFARRTFRAWMLGTFITITVGVLGVLLFYLGVRDETINFALHFYGSLPPGNYPRIDALFVHTNMLCNYLNLSLVIVLIMGARGWLKRVRCRSLLVGTAAVAFFTFSPGLGGIALAAGLWLWSQLKVTPQRRFGSAALAVGVVVAVAFLIASSVTLFAHTGSGFVVSGFIENLRPSHRARAWQTAFETFARHPIFGRGVGMEVSSAFYINPSGGREVLTDAHNTWFSIAGEKGIVGLATFTALLTFLIKRLSTPRAGESSSRSVIRTGFLVALATAFLYQSFAGSFENARHIWVFFGMIAAVTETSFRVDAGRA